MTPPLQFGGPIDGSLPVEERVVITGGLLVLLAVSGWVARHVRERFETGSRNLERAVDAGIALGLFVVALAVGSAILSLWEVAVFSLLGIDRPLAVLTRVAITVLLLLGVYVLTGAVQRFVDEFTEGQEALTRHQTELIFRSTQVSLYVLTAVIALGIWKINLGGLLIGAGFLGIVVGLAARQTLGALIAGFVLMFARPFEIGDWVQVGDREGIVTEISIVNTRIQTFDGEYAMLPNDVVASTEIVNRTRKGRLRVEVEVGVDYDTDLDHAVDVAREAIRDVDDVLAVPQPQVVLKEFGNSSIVLGLRFWIDKPSSRRRWRARTAVIRAVKAAFDREGIKIPFPQRELMGRIEEGGFRLAPEEAPGAEVTPDGGEDGSG